jgi:NhaA family Na+:H+ antiporter
MASMPFAGAIGGMVVPVIVYLALMSGQPGAHGWGVVMATDTAFVVGCLAPFGSRIPASLRPFLLSLAISDDVGAILVMAVGYGATLNWSALSLAALGLVAVAGIARLGIRSVPVYFLLGGLFRLYFDAFGIHATITGDIPGLMAPTRAWVSDAKRLRGILGRVLSYRSDEDAGDSTTDRRNLRRAGIAVAESLSPVVRMEILLHPWAGFVIMPLFALANAGVPISGAHIGQSVSVAIFAGLVFGKPIGVLAFSWLAVRLGLATQALSLRWRHLSAGAFLTGIGSTMSLFIAGIAYAPAMLDAAKIGILTASLFSAATGLLMLAWLTLQKPTA